MNNNAGVMSNKGNKKETFIKFVLVEKNGDLKSSEIKEFSLEEICKKCKFKKIDGFDKKAEWGYHAKNENKIVIELYAKDDGLANQENKYDFPPPADHDLFFGACALICKDSKNNIIDLTIEKWNKVYEYLYGGFDSIIDNDDDEDEEDELENINPKRKTKEGYLKDGFAVDGGESDEDSIAGSGDDSTDSSEEERETDDEFPSNLDKKEEEVDDGFLTDGSRELCEEDYDYSDNDK